QTTDRRAQAVKRAVAAGKHVYCEKPTAVDVATALDLYHTASRAGVKHGVVQDKLWLPGILKLQTLRDLGFFGKILSVRGEFGYWVFEGDTVPAQRPSWNYRKEDGGHHPRYAVPLPLCVGQPVRRSEGRLLPGRYPRAPALG